MALSSGTLKELKAELASLTKQRATIDARIAGLESILNENASSESSGSRPQDKGKRRRRLSLGRSITALFKDGATLRSRDVIEQLRDAGVVVRGKTSLSVRVHSELRRLARRGLVNKRASGEYARIAGRVDARPPQHADTQGEPLPA